MLEAITPLGLWTNHSTVEALSRAATPVQKSDDTRKVYKEDLGRMAMLYDFDMCINYSEERVVYACENIQRETISGPFTFRILIIFD